MADEFIEEFKTLLHGEIGAVETYDIAMKSAKNSEVLRTLEQAKQTHIDRVESLRQHVITAGGVPDESSGFWGPFEKFVQSSAKNEHDAVAMLEEAEAERLVNYEEQGEIVMGPVKDAIKSELLPKQHESHLLLASLLKTLSPEPEKKRGN